MQMPYLVELRCVCLATAAVIVRTGPVGQGMTERSLNVTTILSVVSLCDRVAITARLDRVSATSEGPQLALSLGTCDVCSPAAGDITRKSAVSAMFD